jgi:hypothetical protein
MILRIVPNDPAPSFSCTSYASIVTCSAQQTPSHLCALIAAAPHLGNDPGDVARLDVAASPRGRALV